MIFHVGKVASLNVEKEKPIAEIKRQHMKRNKQKSTSIFDVDICHDYVRRGEIQSKYDCGI